LLNIRRNPDADPSASLRLDGEDIDIEKITVNGKPLLCRSHKFASVHSVIVYTDDRQHAVTINGFKTTCLK
jgi:hypothetical protein